MHTKESSKGPKEKLSRRNIMRFSKKAPRLEMADSHDNMAENSLSSIMNKLVKSPKSTNLSIVAPDVHLGSKFKSPSSPSCSYSEQRLSLRRGPASPGHDDHHLNIDMDDILLLDSSLPSTMQPRLSSSGVVYQSPARFAVGASERKQDQSVQRSLQA